MNTVKEPASSTFVHERLYYNNGCRKWLAIGCKLLGKASCE
jgi:hypothetical protein